MEIRFVEQIGNVIGAQIHSIDFIFAAFQEAFADGAADEAVDSEDQDTFLALRRVPSERACESHFLNEFAVFRKLCAGRVETAFLLCVIDRDRAFAAGDGQRIDGKNGSGECLCRASCFGNIPENVFLFAEEAECTGIGTGYATHEITDFRGCFSPVDRTVFRFAPAEIGGFFLVLLYCFQGAFPEFRESGFEQFRGGSGCVHMNVFCRVIRSDRKLFLCENISVVRLFRHVVKGNARLFFSVDDSPVERTASAVFREQGAVKIDAAFCRNAENVFADHIPVIKGKDEIGIHLLDFCNPERMVDVCRRIERNSFFGGKLCDGLEPDVFIRVVLMRKNRLNLESVAEKSLDAFASDIVVSQNNCFHS